MTETRRARGQEGEPQSLRRDACLSEPTSLVLWEEGDWRCEFNPGLAGIGKLEVYQADQLVFAEEALSGPGAAQRAEILWQRLLRGDLGPTKAPPCRKCEGRVRVTNGRAPLLYFRCDQCSVVGTYNPTSTDS